MIGKSLAHYEILEKIGSGGMGDVYRARDTKLDREVAIKVLPAEMTADAERRRRFEREAKAIAALKHPNIVTIYSVEEADGVHFLTMEYVEGSALSDLIPKEGISLGRFFDIAIPLSDAIADAHQKGITHRDLKPANVMIDHAGRVKVLDFGLAKFFEEAADPQQAGTIVGDSDTQEGQILGTVAYMSPEQAEGKSIDHRSDIFSLGITLYQMATGERPFKGDSNLSILSSILKDTPESVTTLRPILPQQLGRIVQHCLEKDPKRRFQSAQDISNELEALKTEVSTDTTLRRAPVATRRSGSGRRVGIIAAVAVVAIAALFAFNLMRGGGTHVATAEANSLAIFAFENLKDPDDPQRLGQILQELLITDLSGLEALKVFSSQRLYDVQKQLDPGAVGRSQKEIAGAVATTAGAATMMTGTLSQLGEKWILTCQIVDVSNGTIIQSKRIDGRDLYTMVDQLTGEIHDDFRLPDQPGVAEIPIRSKTSESLEAYRHYLTGVDHLNDSKYTEAIEVLEKAIEIDPKFGQAYYKLAVAQWWESNAIGAGKEALEYLLSNELYASDREKRMAEGMYQLVQRRWTDALPIVEQLTRDFPDEKEAWYGLGEAQFHYPGGAKRFESMDAFQRAVALDPDFSLPYRHIFDIISFQKRYEDGIAIADERIASDPDNPLWYRYRVGMVARTGDDERTSAAVAQALERAESPLDRREVYKEVARSEEAKGRLDRAESYMKRALEIDPGRDDPTIVHKLVEYLLDQRKYDECETRTREELAKNPDDQDLHEAIITIQGQRSEYGKAREYAESLVRKYPDNPNWYAAWARNAVCEDSDEAIFASIARGTQDLKASDDRRRFFEAIAFAYASCGECSASKTYFEKALEIDPNNPNLIGQLADIALERGRLDEAEMMFQRALSINPRDIDGLFGMGAVAIQRGDTASAARYFEAGGQAVPVQWVQHWTNGLVGVLKGNLAKADDGIAHLKANASEDSQWDALISGGFSFGWTYLCLGHLERAEDVFRYGLTLGLSKRDSDAHEGLGWTYLHRSDYPRAEEAFGQGLRVGYGHERILGGLAVTKLIQGDLSEAEALVRRALDEGRPHVGNRRLLGYILCGQERYDEARSVAERTVEMDSTRASHELLAWVLVTGDLDVPFGIQLAEHALSIERFVVPNRWYKLPHWASAEHTLGRAYLKQGDPQKALPYLEKAAELQPDRASVRRDLERAKEMAGRRP